MRHVGRDGSIITIRQITSYGQFRQYLKTSENTFIWGLEIATHCDSSLLCAIQILLLTYLLTCLLEMYDAVVSTIIYILRKLNMTRDAPIV